MQKALRLPLANAPVLAIRRRFPYRRVRLKRMILF